MSQTTQNTPEQHPNPYQLAERLGFEIRHSPVAALPAAMRTAIRQAIATCRAHAEAGIQLPAAYFTAGRLSLLLEDQHGAFAWYVCGVRHILDGTHCVATEALSDEQDWLRQLHDGETPPPACRWIDQLLALARRLAEGSPGPLETGDPVAPVLVVVGGAASMDDGGLARVRPLMRAALEDFRGQVISGGTVVGVPGCVGEVAADLAAHRAKHFELVGYLPERLPHDAPKDDRYDRLVPCGRNEFSPEQLLHSWMDVLHHGVRPAQITVLGFGGGRISAAEYRLALAFGATVAVVAGTGGAVDELLADPLWQHLPNLLPIPHDTASVRAVVAPPAPAFEPDVLDHMAVMFHENYLVNSSTRLPDNMKPWPLLPETYKQANRDQARYAIQILEAAGYGVRRAETPVVYQFTERDGELPERMAELEHGRWVVDRLRNGWRPGPRDNQRKLHNCLVPWTGLADEIKEIDRDAVRKFPQILAQAGWEVYRKE